MNNTEDLAASIEQLVRKHISELHRSTAAALERAFALSIAAPRAKQKQSVPRAKANRREPARVADLAERLHAAVCATPGETMGVLARAARRDRARAEPPDEQSATRGPAALDRRSQPDAVLSSGGAGHEFAHRLTHAREGRRCGGQQRGRKPLTDCPRRAARLMV
jgi:hypothetical protein